MRFFLLRSENNYWDVGKITHSRGRLHFVRFFKRAINRQKSDPRIIFFLKFIHQWTSFYHFRKKKKLLIFSLLCKGVQGKRHTNFYQSAVLLYWYTQTIMKLLLHTYESAVSITSLLKTITDPLKEIKWSKQTGQSQIFFLLVPLGTIAQLFMKKKYPASQSL